MGVYVARCGTSAEAAALAPAHRPRRGRSMSRISSARPVCAVDVRKPSTIGRTTYRRWRDQRREEALDSSVFSTEIAVATTQRSGPPKLVVRNWISGVLRGVVVSEGE